MNTAQQGWSLQICTSLVLSVVLAHRVCKTLFLLVIGFDSVHPIIGKSSAPIKSGSWATRRSQSSFTSKE